MLLVFYAGARGIFLLWNWSFFQSQSFSDILHAFLLGVRFDLSATSILTVPAFLAAVLIYVVQSFKKKNRWGSWFVLFLFFGFQIPFLTFNFIDAEFVNFLGRRLTVDAFFLTREVPGKFWSLMLSYGPLALSWLLSTMCFLLAGFLITRKMSFQKSFRKSFISIFALGYFVFLAVCARGGLQNKPIGFAHAQVFTSPMMNNLVMNSSFTIIQTLKRQALPREVFFKDQKEMLSYLDPSGVQPGLDEKTYKLQAKPNIVLIILESFALEYVGKAHEDKKGYTPFIDELAGKSLFFTNTFANARRSIEGIGAIMGGIPALMNEPFISSQYLTNYFLGIGTLLQKEKYETSFFHGAKNGSMYFDQFMKSAGVKNYYGLNEYPNKQEYDGTWGIWDEPFLQWSVEKMSAQKQPFFSAVFTLTSHHPFKIPDQYAGKFPKGDLDIHEAIGYTDYALRKFFETAEKQPWAKNTIFIVTADHTYKSSRPEYDNELSAYRVPLLIYSPGIALPGRINKKQIVQHTDILPTILDLAAVKQKERNHLGRSIFEPKDRFAISFIDNRYLFITEEYILRHNRDGDYQLYSFADPEMIEEIKDKPEEKNLIENRLKAAIQYFSQGLWDNKLYYPSGR